jgi:hypothetical protein
MTEKQILTDFFIQGELSSNGSLPNVGVSSNEKAKECCCMHHPSTRVPYREAKTLIKSRQKIQWREETDGYQIE